jgi:low temperature requirement protein LtrA
MESGRWHAPRMRNPVMREGAQVTPLELFFDLVFVLALTQCTALMADDPTWEGVAQAMLILAVLWWSWGGYAWLTSVINPEEGAVRIAMFAAMGAFLVCALCVPRAFGDAALLFAGAYAVVRAAHIALFWIASRDDPDLRSSVSWLAGSSAVGVGLLVAASALDGVAQGAMWCIAVVLDYAGPYFLGASGWKLVPEHFAERFGLIIIIALGESIVAIGAGVTGDLTAGIVAAAALGITLAAMMWWAYFDVVAVVATRRLASIDDRREQNETARDSYGYLHGPMVAGIILVALGLKKTIEHVDEPLKIVPAFALVGGFAIYLLAHVAFRWRNVHTVNRRRLGLGLGLFVLLPLAVEVPALATLAIVTAVACLLITYEAVRYAEHRDRVRHDLAAETGAPEI